MDGINDWIQHVLTFMLSIWVYDYVRRLHYIIRVRQFIKTMYPNKKYTIKHSNITVTIEEGEEK